jgi:hypothetical protein
MTDGVRTVGNGGNGERRAWGRRAKIALLAVALITVAYYVCLFTGADLDWFVEYAKVMIYCVGFVAGSLTITDTISTWKKG